MNIGKIQIFRMMTTKMRWLEHRQRVLAQNIANADTPGYVPRDLKPLQYGRTIRRESFKLQLVVTNDSHLPGRIRKTAFGDEVQSRETYETSPSGNAVVLEEQLLKVADTAAAHQLVTNLYRKQVRMFRIALGRQAGR